MPFKNSISGQEVATCLLYQEMMKEEFRTGVVFVFIVLQGQCCEMILKKINETFLG
jgi:hypothetical protein